MGRLTAFLIVHALGCGGTVVTSDTVTPPRDASSGTVPSLDATPGFDSTPGFDAAPTLDAAPALDATKSDAGADATTPAIPDGGKATPQCAASGGLFCTAAQWVLCPAGFQPISTAGGTSDCLGGSWCCEPAPVSSCSVSAKANCVSGPCKGCFAPYQAGSCGQEGRSCCEYICD